MGRVLFLTQVLPYPLDSGAKVRAYYVLRHLAQGHDVTLVSFVRYDDEPDFVAHLTSFCHEVHTVAMKRSPLRDARALLQSTVAGTPVIIARDKIAAMHALLRRLMDKGCFDVVHADQTSMAQYGLYARSAARRSGHHPGPRLVLDAHNALCRVFRRLAHYETNPLKRLLLQREGYLLRRYERAACGWFDHLVFVSDVDRRELLQMPWSGAQRASVPRSSAESHEPATCTIPICVDPSHQPLIQRWPNPRSVTHLGTMLWPPNVEGVLWFAREVWPRIVDRVPDARLYVVGKGPPPEVRHLDRHVRSIDITGYVPDPEPYLAETAVLIVPLRAGGGMRVKIVDAWCWGVPIVSTSIGAEGIEIRDGENILIADRPAAMARAVVRVLTDLTLGERLRENGRRRVEKRYDWWRVYAQWDDVYEKLIGP